MSYEIYEEIMERKIPNGIKKLARELHGSYGQEKDNEYSLMNAARKHFFIPAGEKLYCDFKKFSEKEYTKLKTDSKIYKIYADLYFYANRQLKVKYNSPFPKDITTVEDLYIYLYITNLNENHGRKVSFSNSNVMKVRKVYEWVLANTVMGIVSESLVMNKLKEKGIEAVYADKDLECNDIDIFIKYDEYWVPVSIKTGGAFSKSTIQHYMKKNHPTIKPEIYMNDKLDFYVIERNQIVFKKFDQLQYELSFASARTLPWTINK